MSLLPACIQLYTQLWKFNSLLTASYCWLIVLFLVCVCRWSRCGCWIASATNPPMAHYISQLLISFLWRAALTTQHLQDRRSGWVVLHPASITGVIHISLSSLHADATAVNELLVFSLMKTAGLTPTVLGVVYHMTSTVEIIALLERDRSQNWDGTTWCMLTTAGNWGH